MELIILFIIGFIFFFIFFLRDRNPKDSSFDERIYTPQNRTPTNQHTFQKCTQCNNEALQGDDRCVNHIQHGYSSVRCSVCGEKAIPGDSLCHQHNN